MRRAWLLAGWFLLSSTPGRAEEKARPLMRDFIGLCGHTVQFKPELYAPVTRLVRDYHPIHWDLGDDTSYKPKFPFARNGVDWSKVYGSWKQAGYRAHACLMFDDIDPGAWKNPTEDAFAYGKAFAGAFSDLLEAVEIGNEPGKYDDATYRRLFEAMARGVRAGAPKMRIATCAANLGPSGRYSKSVDCLDGLESLYDIVNIHNYAEIESWPTWKRSYAEDPGINFLKDIRHVLAWRNEHALNKELWLTEFGWDATTKPAPTTGDFVKWVGSTETQQAQWTVRGYLVLAALGIDRAYPTSSTTTTRRICMDHPASRETSCRSLRSTRWRICFVRWRITDLRERFERTRPATFTNLFPTQSGASGWCGSLSHPRECSSLISGARVSRRRNGCRCTQAKRKWSPCGTPRGKR